MGRILADHIADNKAFDIEDAIVIQALSSATDEDIKIFREMMLNSEIDKDSEVLIAVKDNNVYCADWCVNNRLCRQYREGYIHDPEKNEYYHAITSTGAGKRLMKYITEVKQIFREGLLG